MPGFSVSIDGKNIATVCADGYDVLSVCASGTRIDDDLAHLEVSGGSYRGDGKSTYLTWVNSLPLYPGQVVTVFFLENASSSHEGKTIEELFTDEAPKAVIDFKPTPEIIKEIREKPKTRDKFSFRLQSSSGSVYVGDTGPDELGFGFTVLWNSFHPERTRMSLHSHTLESLESHGPMNYLVEERMQYGNSVRFELVA